MRGMRALLGAAMGLSLSGCAAFFSQLEDKVTIVTEPAGAECRLERMSRTIAVVRSTPETVTVKRSRFPLDVYCMKDGEAGAKIVEAEYDPVTLANLASWSPTYLIDSITDGDRTLPETITVRFPVKISQ